MRVNLDVIIEAEKAIGYLPEAEQLHILKAVINYLNTGIEGNLQHIESVIFNCLKISLDNERNAVLKSLEIKRANGAKGGRPKAKKPIGYLGFDEKNESLPPTPPISYTTTDNSDNLLTTINNINYIEKEINKEKENLADYEARYRKENMWADAAFVVRTTETKVKEIFETFLAEQKHNNNTYENYPDFTKHFLSYLRISVNKAKSENNGITYQQLNAKRRATEVQKGGDYSQEF